MIGPIVCIAALGSGCDRYNTGDIHRRERHIDSRNWQVSLALDHRCELDANNPAALALEDRIRLEFAIACGKAVAVDSLVTSCERGMDHWLFCDGNIWVIPPEENLYPCTRPKSAIAEDDREPCIRTSRRLR